jgi:hypothetical protein
MLFSIAGAISFASAARRRGGAIVILWIGIFGFGTVAAIWVFIDATDHAEYALVWAVLVAMAWPLFLPIYIFFRLYTARPISSRREQQLNRDRIDPMRYRFASEIEKSRFIEAAEHGPGTMFDQVLGENVSGAGYAHFTVDRAEKLIQEQRYDEAWDYLTELYTVAMNDNDARALDTYKHYLLRLPNGAPRFRDWLEAAQQIPDKPAVKPSHEVPF